MSRATSKANPAKTILIMFLLLLGTASASYSIDQQNPNSSEVGYDDEYSDGNYTFRANPNTNGENSFGVNTHRGALSSTGVPNAEGMVFDDYNWGQNTIQTSNGMVQADNTFHAKGNDYQSGHGENSILNVTIPGGDPTSAQMILEWNAYDYNPGLYDHVGADVHVQFDGMYDNPVMPATLGPSATETETFQTGIVAGCNQQAVDNIDSQCFMNGWELVLPLCADANCTGSTHDSNLYVGNGIYDLSRVNWAISSDSVDTHLVYTMAPFSGGTNVEFDLFVREGENEDWQEMVDGDARTNTNGKFEYSMVMTGGSNKHYTHEYATPISGITPSASGCDDTPSTLNKTTAETPGNAHEGGEFHCGKLPTTTSIWFKGENIIFSVSVGDLSLVNATSLTHVQYDPSVNFHDNMNSDSGQVNDGNWRVGVDRDGCDVYQYACGTSVQNDHYGQYEIGDGWCGDNSVDWDEGNAACRFSGLTTSIFGLGSDNWDANAWNTAMSAMPVFDTSNDFDGMVIEMSIDKSTFTSQGSTGWYDMALELGLQAPAYTDGAWSPGVLGDGGFFEACYNGYVDVYVLPENVWEYWYQDAKFGYNYFNDPNNYGDKYYIEDDDDWLSEDEFWYNPGTTAGAGSNGNGYQYPHSETSYDYLDGDYWAHPNWLGAQSNPQLFSADMKVNMWHQSLNDEDVPIYDGDVERGITNTGVWDKPGTSGHPDSPEFVDSTFQQINDFWDINLFDDDDVGNSYPAGLYVASQDSALSIFHANTIQLGTATSDFCYDPITGNALNRVDSTGDAIEPNQHIVQDSVSGESVLNIEIPYTALVANAATRTNQQLLDSGWIDSITDSTVGMTILVDVRGRDGPSQEICWGDWATGTNEINDISAYDDDFCLDKNGLVWPTPGHDRNSIPFSDFSADTPCLSNEPQSGQQAGQNPDRAFWCGLNFDTPFSDWESIRLKATSAPYVPPADTDGDGIIDQFDDCPNTPIGTQVGANGCAINGGGGTGGGNGGNQQGSEFTDDEDNDGVVDAWDRCDGIGAIPSNTGVGASDYTWYHQADPTTGVTPMQAWETSRTVVNAEGCPTPNFIDPDPEPCNSPSTPDVGRYSYEDNDGDGQKDEDWIDGIDNDGDGLIDEDWIDDCPFDGVDLRYDGLWTGHVQISQESRATTGDSWTAHPGDAAIAEPGTGVASGNAKYVMNASSENWDAIFASAPGATKVESANGILVNDDLLNQERFTCSATQFSNLEIRMFMYLWVEDENGTVDSPYPGESGTNGKWVPYGSAHFDNSIVSDNYGWTDVSSRMTDVDASTSPGTDGDGILATDTSLAVAMGEGYYKISCVATIPHQIATGQQVDVQGEASTIIVAVEPCGENETREGVFGACTVETTSGGGIGDDASEFWDALVGSAIAIAVLIAFVAISAALWYIDRKEGAVGVAVAGLGVAVAFFEYNVAVDNPDVWGTLSHLLIAGGIITGFWPYEGEPGKVALVSLLIGVWGLIHLIQPENLLGLEEYYIPAITGIPAIVAVLGLGLGLFAAAVQFQVVDDPTGIID